MFMGGITYIINGNLSKIDTDNNSENNILKR